MVLTSESRMDILETQANEKAHPKRKHFRKDVISYLKEYLNKSGIHGMQYIAEERTIYERLWWIIFFLVSLGACIYMITMIYFKWLDSPVLVSFATKKTPIYQIPFPAITICPKIKIDKSRSGCFNLTNYRNRIRRNLSTTPEDDKYAAYMHVLCDEELTDYSVDYIDAQDFYKYIIGCEPNRTAKVIFQGKYFENDFHDLFRPIYTEEGLCYSFNRIRLDEMFSDQVIHYYHEFEDFPNSTWHSEYGYNEDAGIDTYPRRALMANIKNGLGIYFFEDKRNIDYDCDPVLQGYTVTLHIPSRFPGTREEFFFLPIGSAMLAPIEGHMVLTSKKVKAYSPHKRNCYFPSERKLEYFKQYTSKNCKFECLTNHFLKICGCVLFFMPRNGTTKICGPAELPCTYQIEIDSKLNELKRRLSKRAKTKLDKVYNNCNCLPMCNDIVYSADAAPLGVDTEKVVSWLSDLGVLDDEIASNPNILATYIMFYFKDESVETTERNELYGPSDFLSNFGGLMGLFTGFSMLSCIEIIYFLSLRIIGNIDLFGHWTGIPH